MISPITKTTMAMKTTGTANAVIFRPPDLAVDVDVATSVTAAETVDVAAAVG